MSAVGAGAVFYGWVIVACGGCASFARQGAAVATLSIFVTPMVAEFDWSRGAISGAVSLGGVMGALVAPAFGTLVDRAGARAVLIASALVVSVCAFALAGITGLVGFYLFFSLARMMFAGPFDIGIHTAVANWFIRQRGRAMSYVSGAAAGSLAIMPLLADVAIDAYGWRGGWIAVGAAVLIVGVVPIALFMRRRPEDMGLAPDGDAPVVRPAGGTGPHAAGAQRLASRDFTRAEALRTPTFWLLMLYTALAFCMQAGISLHQAPFLIEQGLDSTTAALIVSTFSLSAAAGALLYGQFADRAPMRAMLGVVALQLVVAALAMREVDSAASGYGAAVLFGLGIGGLLTLPQVAFAAYYGRANYGAIRGLALSAQVTGQAMGPLLAGLLHDVSGSYHAALLVFAGLGCVAAAVGFMARPPAQLR